MTSQVMVSYDEDEDIIALANLKGYDISGIRRQKNLSLPEKMKIHDNIEPPIDKNFVGDILNETNIPIKQEIVLTVGNALTNFNEISIENEQATISEPLEWSNVPTRDEETIKALKNKIANMRSDLDKSELNYFRSASQLEQAQKRISLLERELLEQSKAANSIKLSNEAQINSLRAVNHEMMSKLSSIEADNFNLSILKNELDRSKETILLLQTEIFRFEDEKRESIRQLADLKGESSLLREQTYLAEALKEKCKTLEGELEESRRDIKLQVETSQAELQLTRAKLEGEIAFHRAEHANSVGSSTALHQEIFQLKSELSQLTKQDSENRAKIYELEELNTQLLQKIEEHQILDFEIEKAKTDVQSAEAEVIKIKTLLLKSNDQLSVQMNERSELEDKINLVTSELSSAEEKVLVLTNEILALKTEIFTKNSQISDLKENKGSYEPSEIDILLEKLAESEIKISGLQSDLNREIKRADISKKVYEAKLAELENMKN